MRLGFRSEIVSMLAVVAGGSAFACSPPIPSPPPPPRVGVSEASAAAFDGAWAAAQKTLGEARERRHAAEEQRRLYETAESVVLARVDRREETPARSFLVPMQWLKGNPAAGELAFTLSTWTTCRPVVSANGVHGEPGEVFLVYLKGDALLQAETLDAQRVSKIVDPETLAILSLALMLPQ